MIMVILKRGIDIEHHRWQFVNFSGMSRLQNRNRAKRMVMEQVHQIAPEV